MPTKQPTLAEFCLRLMFEKLRLAIREAERRETEGTKCAS